MHVQTHDEIPPPDSCLGYICLRHCIYLSGFPRILPSGDAFDSLHHPRHREKPRPEFPGDFPDLHGSLLPTADPEQDRAPLPEGQDHAVRRM